MHGGAGVRKVLLRNLRPLLWSAACRFMSARQLACLLAQNCHTARTCPTSIQTGSAAAMTLTACQIAFCSPAATSAARGASRRASPPCRPAATPATMAASRRASTSDNPCIPAGCEADACAEAFCDIPLALPLAVSRVGIPGEEWDACLEASCSMASELPLALHSPSLGIPATASCCCLHEGRLPG